MAWRISGSYLATCSCNLICPCPVDGPPTSEDGQCRGFLVFSVKEGSVDDTDVSGVNVAGPVTIVGGPGARWGMDPGAFESD